MPKVIINTGDDFEKALKRFSREASPIRKEARKREYYLTKKEKRQLKNKNAKKY